MNFNEKKSKFNYEGLHVPTPCLALLKLKGTFQGKYFNSVICLSNKGNYINVAWPINY